MCILRGLKIPHNALRMDQFPRSLAENVRRGLSYDAHLIACSDYSSFSEARKDSCLASEGPDSEDMSYQGSVLDIKKHPRGH